MSRIRFHHFAWGLLVYTFPVILWGAFVRASKSGDGCGSHWPTCNGDVIPQDVLHAKTWVEYGHRLSSGLMLPLVLVMLIWAFRAFPKKHPARWAAFLTLVFTCTEGAIGAKLVLHGLVADNSSASRAIYMSAHLINTFLLLGVMTQTAWYGSGRKAAIWRGQGIMSWSLAFGIIAVLVLGVSGAVAALGDTLFPVRSSAQALRDGFSPLSHFLTRLRLWHPLIAIAVGMYLNWVALLLRKRRPGPEVDRLAAGIIGIFVLQMVIGLVNVRLLAPIWMQLVHLFFADLIWINLMCLAMAALAHRAQQEETSAFSSTRNSEEIGNEVNNAWPVKTPSVL